MTRSAHNSYIPQFHSGNIKTPPSHNVTDRKSTRVIMGRDDAPRPALEYTKTRDEIGRPVKNDSLASERANVGPSRKAEATILTYGERSAPMREGVTVTRANGLTIVKHDLATLDDAAMRVYRDSEGHVVRTTDMGDEVRLDVAVAAREAMASTLPQGKPLTAARKRSERVDERKLRREQQESAVRAVCAAYGFTGEITPLMRSTVLEMIEAQRQING